MISMPNLGVNFRSPVTLHDDQEDFLANIPQAKPWTSTPPQLAHRLKVQERCLSVSLIDVRGVALGIEKSLL